ncbi:myb family transcription factor PHL5-like [Vitis riparia]|uniref:myb family transcription factor PHL5-like n=1 Tax=Vitis riparia TaxID=96939 RepID=UPI00155A80E6|nr:myb family transcription factor PHL5-like [Vitis riparia]
MNTQKIDVQKQKTGSVNCYSGKGSTFSRQPWKMELCFQPDQFPASEGGSPKQMINLGNTANMSTTIAGHFGSPAASAFYATEVYMGFPECDSYPVDSETLSYPSSNLDPASSQSRDTQNIPSCLEKSFGTPYRNSPVCDILFIKSEVEDEHPYRILRENQNQRIPYQLVEPSPRFQLRRQSANPSHGTYSVASGNSSSPAAAASNKSRIRWTHDLHKRFVESVNRLGGAEKATPKGILRLMGSEGVTIFQIKSHLQKYPIARHLPGSTEEKSEKGTCADFITKFDPETGARIAEALRLQLEVQTRLHEQLEIQRNLQLQIEEQGKQLKKMLDSNRIQIRP